MILEHFHSWALQLGLSLERKHEYGQLTSMENVCINPFPSGSKAGTGATCVTWANSISLLTRKNPKTKPSWPHFQHLSLLSAHSSQWVPAQPLTRPSMPLWKHPVLPAAGTATHRPKAGEHLCCAWTHCGPTGSASFPKADGSEQRWGLCLLCSDVSPLISPFSVSRFTRSGPVLLDNKYQSLEEHGICNSLGRYCWYFNYFLKWPIWLTLPANEDWSPTDLYLGYLYEQQTFWPVTIFGNTGY